MGAYDYLLSGAQPVQLPDPVKMAGSMLTLANAARQGQLANYTLAKAQRDDANAQALQQAIPGLDPSDPASVQAAMQRFPQAAQGIAAYVQNAKKAAAETGFKEAETKKQTADANTTLLGALGGQAYALSQKPDLNANDIKAFYGAAQKLGVDPSVIGAPSDPSNPDAWRQQFGAFANLSRKASDQITQAGAAQTRAEQARHNQATEGQAATNAANTANYQAGELALRNRAADLARVQADPLGILGLNPGTTGQPAPQSVPTAPQGPPPSVPAPGSGTVQGPNGPVVTPDAQTQRNQGRLAILTQERDDQLRTTGKVDPALMAEIDATTKSLQSGNPFAAGQGPNPQPPSFASAGGTPAAQPTAREAIASGAHGDDLLKALPGPIGDQVKALAEGRLAFPSSFALKTPYWQTMLSLVGQYDPTFDAINYNTRAATRKDFTSGKSATSLNALNTVMQHLDEFQKAGQALDNTDIPIWNRVANFAAKETGDPRIDAFNTAKQTVISELERAYRGGAGSEGDLQRWNQQISDASSPAQLQAVLKEITGLLGGKINALGEQYNKGMGTSEDGLQLLNPRAQEVFNRLSGNAAPAAQAKPSAPAAPKEGDVQGGYVYRGGDPADPKSWLKVGS